MRRQRPERRELDRDRLAPARVLARDEVLEEGLVGGEIVEVARAAQQKRLLEPGLEMAVCGLDRAVLVADPGIVAGRLHAVVAAELGIAGRLVLPARQVAIGGREPIGAMRARHPAELPERLLKGLGERREALSPQIALTNCQPL